MYDLKYISDNGNIIHFNFKSGFVVSSINDMTAIPINVSLSQGIGQIGGTVQGESVQSKDIVLNGQIIGKVGGKRKHLLDTVLPGVGGKFVYNDTWELTVRPLLLPSIQNYDYDSKFQFTVRAPYPYWQNAKTEMLDFAEFFARFSFPWNYAVPHMFGERVQIFLRNYLNEGNVPINFVLTFRALDVVSNPYITKVSTGEQIKINREMKIGEIITVDMTASPMTVKSVYQKITTDIFGNLDLDSVPFKLDVGDNRLRYGAEANEEKLDCWIQSSAAVTGPY